MRVVFLFFLVLFLHNAGIGNTKTLTDDNIRQFLKENPSVVLDVLRANSVELLGIVVEGSEKEARQELDQQTMLLKKELEKERNKKPFPINTEKRPSLGSEKAPVVMVAYSDFLCPYCANSAENVSQVLAQNKNTRYVFKSYTRNPLGQLAYAYFLALGEKNNQHAFDFYNILFANQEKLAKEKESYLVQLTKDLGYDPKQIQNIVKSSEIQKIIKEDMEEGNGLSIKGTPTMIINGKYTIVGAVPSELLLYATEYIQNNP